MAGNYSAEGSYVYTDDWRAEVSVTVVDTNDTTCTVTVTGKWRSIYGNSSYCTGQITKDASNNKDTGISMTITTGGSGTFATRQFTVARGDSTKYVTCQAIVVGGGSTYSGVSSTASVSVPIPAIAYTAPEPPTDCAASRVSDTSATVSWTNGATSTVKPRSNVLIERMTGDGNWTQIASAASTATSYSDNSISANHRYAYRVRSYGKGGYSSYSTADGYVYTTPAAPSSVVLSKTAQTTIQVDVEGSAPYATGYAVELTYDGGSTWESVESSTSLPITVTVSGGTVQFRVASLNDTLQSAWALSESIVTICPPLAPTITSRPSNPTAMGDSCTVEWLPNHPDGTAQTAAHVKITRPSGTTSTVDLTTEKTYTFTPELSGTYSIQVRTKGLDEDWGAWSDSVSWGVYEPPVVVVTSPATDGSEVVALPLTVSWTVDDVTGVSTQRVIIADASGEVFNRQVDGSTFSLSLTDSDVALQNGTAYTITVRSMGGSGLITTVQRTFAVSWLPPVAPTLELSEGEGASTQISIASQTFDLAGEVLELPRSGIMTSLHIDGKSVQDGTPSPSSPVPIKSVEGRNLFDPNVLTTSVSGAITYSVDENNTLTVTQGDGQAWAAVPHFHLDAGTYTFSRSNKNGFVALRASIDGYASNFVLLNQAQDKATFTLSADCDVAIKVGYSSTAAEYPFTVDCMLNKGASAIEYMPYGSIGVVSHGTKNFIRNGSERYSLTTSQFARYDGDIVPDSAEHLTFSVSADVPSGQTLRLYGITAAGSNSEFSNSPIPQREDGRYAVTIPERNMASARMVTEWRIYSQPYTGGTSVVTEVYDAQLELGSTATEYEPYQGTTTPIDLQGNALRSLPDGTRDALDVVDGRWVLTKRAGMKVIDGANVTVTTNMDYSSAASACYRLWLSNADQEVVGAGDAHLNMLCDTFAVTSNPTTNPTVAAAANTCEMYLGGILFMVPASEMGSYTVAAANAWFADHPTTVIYPLAEPQTIDLGPAELPYCTDTAYVDAMVTPNISASFRYADSADTPETESVTVQRVNPDGSTWTVASNLPLGGTCIDPLPPLGVEAVYLATASAASGSTASETYTAMIGGMEWVLNFGNAAESSIEFEYNPEASYSLEHGGELYHLADGGEGDGLPVWYGTTDRDEIGSLSFSSYLYSDFDTLRTLCMKHPISWLRDPYGHRWRAHITPSSEHGMGKMWGMSVDWSAVRFREAW